MRQPDGLEVGAGFFDHLREYRRLVTRIDEDRAPTFFIHHQVGVFGKWADGAKVDLHALYPPAPSIAPPGVPSFNNLRYFSAAIAAVVASPTAVVTWRVSCDRRSPAANNPRMLVCML